MADYNLSKADHPRWSAPGASGPGLPLNSAALRITREREAEFAHWYEALVASGDSIVTRVLNRRRAP